MTELVASGLIPLVTTPHASADVPAAPTSPAAPLLLAVVEAAELLGVGRSTLYELINTGQLRTVKVGRRRLVHRNAITEFAQRLDHAAAPGSTPNHR